MKITEQELNLIKEINKSIENTFKKTSLNELKPKDIMGDLISRKVLKSDNKNGNPLRKILRKLHSKRSLNLINNLYFEQKPKIIYWYFRNH